MVYKTILALFHAIVFVQIAFGPYASSSAHAQSKDYSLLEVLPEFTQDRSEDFATQLTQAQFELLFVGYHISIWESEQQSEEEILMSLYEIARKSYELLYVWIHKQKEKNMSLMHLTRR